MKPYVIAICHNKGGVAKTTTTSALGASLAENNLPTLLVDLDPSANLTAGLGFTPRQLRDTTADILLGNAELATLAKPVGIPGLSIVPSGPDMAPASKVLAIRPQYETILRRSIHQNNLAYEYVIIDCPPSLAALTTTALIAADLTIIPMQCEYFALQAISSIFATIHRVRNDHNHKLSYKLLITMFDRRGKLHTQLYEKLKAHYNSTILGTVIGFDSKLRASQVAGQAITSFAPKTRAAEQYRNLAKEINDYVQERRILQPN
jgi:chromosome partitioning protein